MSTARTQAPVINPRMNATEWGLMLLLTAVWSGTFFFNAIALEVYPPATVVAGRVVPAAILLWIVARASGLRMPSSAKDWGAFIVMGVLNGAIPFALIVWGQTRIDSGLAAIFNATTPIFAVVLTHFLTDNERLTPARFAGVLCGVAGVAVIVGPEALFGIAGDVLGQLAVMGAALSYALASIWGRRRLGKFDPKVAAAGQVSGASLIVLPVWLVLDQPWTLPFDAGALAALAAVSVFGTAIAYLLYFRILATAGATNLMLVTLLLPFGAIALGAVFLDEALGWTAFAGLGLIVLGLATLDGRVFSRLRRRRGAATA